MLNLDGKVYKLNPDVVIKFRIKGVPGTAGAVVLQAHSKEDDTVLKGNGMRFTTVRAAQSWCINAGHIEEHDYKGGKKKW